MSSISVPPGCVGVELPNGQKLDADKSGRVKIDDPRVEKFALKSVHAQNGVVSRTTLGFGSVKGNSSACTSCTFTGFAWHTVCPKCGSEMKQVMETQ